MYRTIELLKKLWLIDELDLMHLHGEKHYYEVKTLPGLLGWLASFVEVATPPAIFR